MLDHLSGLLPLEGAVVVVVERVEQAGYVDVAKIAHTQYLCYIMSDWAKLWQFSPKSLVSPRRHPHGEVRVVQVEVVGHAEHDLQVLRVLPAKYKTLILKHSVYKAYRADLEKVSCFESQLLCPKRA